MVLLITLSTSGAEIGSLQPIDGQAPTTSEVSKAILALNKPAPSV